MELLLLWQWSTSAQILSGLLIAVFFAVVGRSTGRHELDWFLGAWLANLLALGITLAFWFLQPSGTAAILTAAGYLFAKTSFLALLLVGALSLARGEPVPARALRWLAAIALCALPAAWLLDGIDWIGVAQSSLIGLVLLAGALICLRARGRGLGWLAFGFLLRALLAVLEALAYGARLAIPTEELHAGVGIFLAAHSSFDAGAEWVIALGCVIALAHRVQTELALSNMRLHSAHGALSRLAERDPLTGLLNRRMLDTALAEVRRGPAVLLFIDLDDFKRVNDELGHAVGDACLQRFASGLQSAFPSEAALLRFAGDEFLVVAHADPDEAAKRVEGLRVRLSVADAPTPGIGFSVGILPVAAGVDPELALHQADQAMYRDKARRRSAHRAALEAGNPPS